MCNYITPNDSCVVGNSDSQSIQNAVNYAVKTGLRKVVIPRVNERTGKEFWDIEKAIILCSDIEIVLDNCLLRQADNVFDNVFRSHFTSEETMQKSAQLHDIRIIGKGHAVIDGGVHNGLNEFTSLKNGFCHVSRNNMILLMNVKNFVIENISFENHRWWAINLIYAEYGRLSNLRIFCDCENPNLDGIDLRPGCHDIIIENITGQAGDDLVALSALGAYVFTSDLSGRNNLEYEGRAPDIHDITIRNVIGTSVNCAVIALRSCDGKKVYNVVIDNVHDVDNNAIEDGKLYPEYPKSKIGMDIRKKYGGNSPYALLRVGQYGYFKNEQQPILGEIYDITATNLYSRGGVAVMLNVGVKNSYFGNIHAENDVDYVITTKSGRVWQRYGAELTNVVFENIFYDNVDNKEGVAFDFDVNEENYNLKNVVISKAFVGNCKNVFNVKQTGKIVFNNIFGEHVENQSGEVVNNS